MHILRQTRSAWPATTTKQPEGHFSFSSDWDSNSEFPSIQAYCTRSPWRESSATCPVHASRSYGSLRIWQHLGRTKSCRSYWGHQSSQHVFRFTYIPAQEVGGDLPLKILTFASEFQAEKELLATIPYSEYPDPDTISSRFDSRRATLFC